MLAYMLTVKDNHPWSISPTLITLPLKLASMTEMQHGVRAAKDG